MDTVIDQDEFVFNGHPTRVYKLLRYIKLPEHTPINPLWESDLDDLDCWLKEVFPREGLRLWIYNTLKGDVQFFLTTNSFLSVLFIFMVLINF